MSETTKQLKSLFYEENGKTIMKRRFTVEASGRNYTIRSVSEPFSIVRISEMQKLSVSLGVGATFQEMYEGYTKIQEMVNGIFRNNNTVTDLIMFIESQKEKIIDLGEKRFPAAYYYCSLFIVEDGEDVTQWSYEAADDKINDWNKEYDGNDFLALALNFIPELSAYYAKQIERQITKAKRVRPLGSGGSKKTEAGQV